MMEIIIQTSDALQNELEALPKLQNFLEMADACP
jgi:hypothetical protein